MAKNTKKATTATKKAKRLSDAEIYALAAEYEEAHKEEGSAKKKKGNASKQIIAELQHRKSSAIESNEYGGFTRVTLVAPERVEYNSDGIWSDLTPAQRREAFDTFVNLNQLPTETRKKVVAMLTKEERRAVTTHILNTDRMSQAVQNGKIDATEIEPHSTIVPIAPSIRVSHGSGD